MRNHSHDIATLFDTQTHAGSRIGYLHQLLAGAVWTSLPMLPAIRQHTLIVAATAPAAQRGPPSTSAWSQIAGGSAARPLARGPSSPGPAAGAATDATRCA